MFRKEIKFIYDFNLNKVHKLGAYLTFEQISKAEIHPAILHYISAEIDYLIFEDRQKILKNSIFDYSGEKVSSFFNQIGEEVKKNKRFSIEFIAQLILHSASFTVNYLARPRWALMKLIFEDDEHKSTTEIKQILNYVYYYGYLKKIITSYINRKKILSLNYNEFEDLLNKIDDLGFQSDFGAILESALQSMADFFNIGETHKKLIPIQSIELFLREKKLHAHLVKLRDVFPQDEKLIYDLNDYKKAFSTIRRKDPEEFQEAAPEILDEDKYKQDTDEDFVEEEILVENSTEYDEGVKITIEDKDEEIINEFNELPQFGSELDVDEEKYSLSETLSVIKDDQQDEDLHQEEVLPHIINVADSPEGKLDEDKISHAEEIETNSEEDYEYLKEQHAPIANGQDVIDQHEESGQAEDDVDEAFLRNDENSLEEIESEKEQEVASLDFEETEEIDELSLDEESDDEDELILVEEEVVEESDDESLIYDPEIREEPTEKETGFDETTELKVDNTSESEDEQTETKPEKTNGSHSLGDELSLFESLDEIENQPVIDNGQSAPEANNEEPTDSLIDNSGEDKIKSDILADEEISLSGESENDAESIDQIEEEQDEFLEPTSEKTQMEVSELLERKNMTKVIEVIFDYDIEEFAYVIDRACTSETEKKAMKVLDKLFKNNHVSPASKEAETLKSIISEFFNKKED